MSFGRPATKFEIDLNDPSVCLEKLKYECSHEKIKKNILLFANQLLEIVGRGGSSKFSPCLFLSSPPLPLPVNVSCWGSCLHINWWNILTHAIIKDIFKFASCLKITIKYTLLFNPIVGIAFFCIATPPSSRSPNWLIPAHWDPPTLDDIIYVQDHRENVSGIIKSRQENTTGCLKINAPKFLLNFSGYKQSRKLGHILN